MPASTVGEVEAVLANYVEEDTTFLAALNQVLARMHTMGTYKDLTIQYNLNVLEGCITLPDEADSVLHVLVDTEPRPTRDLWHDFIQPNARTVDQTWGIVDSGFHPAKLETLGSGSGVTTLYIVPSPKDYLTTAFDTTAGYASDLIVDAIGSDQVYRGTVGVSGPAKVITFGASVDKIFSITYKNLPAIFDIRTTDTDSKTDVARIGPGSGTTRYRKFRVSGATDSTTSVVVLAKRKFKPLRDSTDIVYLGNVNALKHGFLGRVAEDNADLERAEYHWATCRQLLEEEMSSARGAALPTMKIDLYGGNTAVKNSM
tara:strand:+ start:5492 stop:6436 length:945 start_codon:yes stop_codon:yes gene_type:complete